MHKSFLALWVVGAGVMVAGLGLAQPELESDCEKAAPVLEYEGVFRVAWTDTEGATRAKGVILHRRHSQGSGYRLFLDLPSQGRIVLTTSFGMASGETTQILRFEDLDWQVVITRVEPVRYESWQEMRDSRILVAKIMELGEAGEPLETGLIVEAGGFPRQTLHLGFSEEDEEETVEERLEREGLGQRLVASAPPEVWGLSHEARAVVCAEGEASRFCFFDEILATVETLFSRHRPPGVELTASSSEVSRPKVELEVLETRREFRFTTQSLIFLERFDSFEQESPFAGTWAEMPGEGASQEPL